MIQTIFDFPSPTKETVKEKVEWILKNHDWITLAELRSHFNPFERGAQSCGRYLRKGKGFLGDRIEKRKRSGHTYEYRLKEEEQ